MRKDFSVEYGQALTISARDFKTLKLYKTTGENRNVLKRVLTGFNSQNSTKI